MLNFFSNKIMQIRYELEVYALFVPGGECPSFFTEFKTLEEKDVRALVMKSKIASCNSDPMPTSLVKQHLDVLLPLLTRI